MSKVRVLPDIIINKIAAGEVVERPASIVKELVENSLDAGSTRIFVDIEDGGKRQIKISDNGEGMEYEDALLAVERHATSKIISDADLFSISTLGFRGEALPSIASISRFSLETRTKTAQAGVQIHINGGKILNVDDSGCAPGTIITAKDIFFNTPARRKFLKTSQTETAHITEMLTCLSLPWPSVHFRLTCDGRMVKNLPSVASPFERAVDVIGRDLRGKMLYVEKETEAVTLSGWISEPDVTKGGGQKIYLFVNGRHVRDRGVIHAMCDAYKGSLMKGRFPVAVMFLDLPDGTVDVNVHPTKQEVRFSNQREIYGAVRAACHDALMKREAVKNAPVKGQGGFAISNRPPKPYEPQMFKAFDSRPKDVTLASNITTSSSGLISGGKENPAIPGVSDSKRPSEAAFDRSFVPVMDNLSGAGGNLTEQIGDYAVREEVDYGFREALKQDESEPCQIENVLLPENETLVHGLSGFEEIRSALPQEAASHDKDEKSKGGGHPSERTDTSEAMTANAVVPSLFSSLRIIGQLRKSYILCDSESGLVIFDQHAAHERVVYERFRDMATGVKHPSVQRLLVPEIVEFSPKETLIVLEILDDLSSAGIEIEHFGENSFAVRAVPALLPDSRIRELLSDVVERISEFSGKKPDHEEIFGECFSVMACHAAIRNGQELAMSDMRNLLNDLSKCGNPYHCPHGRPVYMVLGDDEMEKRFGRKG